MSHLFSRLVLFVFLLQGGSLGDHQELNSGPLAFTAGQSGGLWQLNSLTHGTANHKRGPEDELYLPREVFVVRGVPLLLRCHLGRLSNPLHSLNDEYPSPLDGLEDSPGPLGNDYDPSIAMNAAYNEDTATSPPQYYDYYTFNDDQSTSDRIVHAKVNSNVNDNFNEDLTTNNSTSTSSPSPVDTPPHSSLRGRNKAPLARRNSKGVRSPPEESSASPTAPVLSATTVTWYKNDRDDFMDHRHVITASGHLNITRTKRKEVEGTYRCVVRTAIGSISGPPLRVSFANIGRNTQVEVVALTEGQGQVGGVARLACSVTSNPPARLVWEKNGVEVTTDNSRIVSPSPGVLQILSLRPSDAGDYQCIAHHAMTRKTRRAPSISLTVHTKEEILTSSVGKIRGAFSPIFLSPYAREHLSAIGGNLTIECLANGIPLPTLRWMRAVGPDEWEPVVEDEHFRVSGQGNLHLINVQPFMKGKYACLILHTSDQQETEVVLYSAPKIIDPPKNIVTLIAQTSRLNCSVEGNSKPVVKWYKNGELLREDERIKKTEGNQLVFTNSVTMDSALYQCTAVNEAGYVSSWAHMLVNSSLRTPPPPRIIRYHLRTSNSVFVEWTVDSFQMNKIIAYSVHITEMGSHRELQKVVKNNSITLNELKLNTNYSFSVRAFSELASDPSEPIIIHTGEEIPEEMPQTKVKVLSPTELLVQWIPLPPEKARGTIIGYKVQWKKKNLHYYNVKETLPHQTELKLTELQPGVKYSVRVLGGTSVGYPEGDHMLWKNIRMPSRNPDIYHSSEDSYYDNRRTQAPLPDPVPMPPNLNLSVYWMGRNNSEEDFASGNYWAVKATWLPLLASSSMVEGYTLRYAKEGKHWHNTITLPASNNSYVIAGLEAGLYKVEVRGFNLAGDGDPTVEMIETKEFANKTKPIVVPTIDKIEVHSQTSIQIWWSIPAEYRDMIKFFTVRYRALSPSYSEPERLMHSMAYNVLVSGLKPFTWYEFSVRSHASEDMFGEYCHPVQVATTDKVPAAPTRLEFSPVDASTVVVSWLPPEVNKATPEATMYELLYTQNKTLGLPLWSKMRVMSKNNHADVTGLVSNTEYWFRVRGCAEDERCGAYSDSANVTIKAWLHHPDASSKMQTEFVVYGMFLLLCVILVISMAVCLCIRVRSVGRTGHGYFTGVAGDGPQANGLQYPNNGYRGVTSPDMNASGLHEMEVYVPMLTQIPPDFNSRPLDSKGTCTNHTVRNGFSGSYKCTHFIKSTDNHEEGDIFYHQKLDGYSKDFSNSENSSPCSSAKEEKTISENLNSTLDSSDTLTVKKYSDCEKGVVETKDSNYSNKSCNGEVEFAKDTENGDSLTTPVNDINPLEKTVKQNNLKPPEDTNQLTTEEEEKVPLQSPPSSHSLLSNTSSSTSTLTPVLEPPTATTIHSGCVDGVKDDTVTIPCITNLRDVSVLTKSEGELSSRSLLSSKSYSSSSTNCSSLNSRNSFCGTLEDRLRLTESSESSNIYNTNNNGIHYSNNNIHNMNNNSIHNSLCNMNDKTSPGIRQMYEPLSASAT